MTRASNGIVGPPLNAAEARLLVQALGLGVVGFSLNYFFYYAASLVRLIVQTRTYGFPLNSAADPDTLAMWQLSFEGDFARNVLQTLFWGAIIACGLSMARGNRRLTFLLAHRSS
jgi:hypothetical protein